MATMLSPHTFTRHAIEGRYTMSVNGSLLRAPHRKHFRMALKSVMYHFPSGPPSANRGARVRMRAYLEAFRATTFSVQV